MSLRIVEEAGLTDVGRQRSSNEDNLFEGAPIFAVADGMGGARAGEVASKMAVDVFAEMGADGERPEQHLEAIAKEANRRIYELAQRDESRAGMGCTLTAAFVGDGEITIGHVGDSRAYRLRGEKLEQLTSDHSLVEELVRQGKLTAEEAEVHPQRSIITRALGPEPEVEVDAFTHSAKPDDVYLLCSDGLTGMVPDPRIAEILLARSSLKQAAQELIAAANENGGRDNITVVLFRLGEGDSGPEDPDTLSGKETNVALSVDEIREAAATTRPSPTQVTRQSEPRDETRVGNATMVLDAESARAARQADAGARASPARPPARPRRLKRVVGSAVALLVVAAVVVGLYAGSRQFWFVGTNDQGLLTLYQGLPYELPLGIELYSEEYVSTVPSRSIRDERVRERVIDHKLRSRGDAVDLIRQYERPRTGS